MNNTFVNTDTADTAKEDCMDNVYVNTDTATSSKAGKEGRRMEKKTVIGMMAVTMVRHISLHIRLIMVDIHRLRLRVIRRESPIIIRRRPNGICRTTIGSP